MTNKDALSNDNDKCFVRFRSVKTTPDRIIDYEKLSPSEIMRYKRIEHSQLVKSIKERRLYNLKSDVLDNKQEDAVDLSIDDNSSCQRLTGD